MTKHKIITIYQVKIIPAYTPQDNNFKQTQHTKCEIINEEYIQDNSGTWNKDNGCILNTRWYMNTKRNLLNSLIITAKKKTLFNKKVTAQQDFICISRW